jgi:hypothetical protein
MPILNAYKTNPNAFDLAPLPVDREWMDKTPDKHAYRCFPVTLANTIGWTVSAKEDISFVWDGIIDTTDSHVKILKGNNIAYTGRGQGTVSFNTGLIFRSEKDISLMVLPLPNYFITDFVPMSSVISTSFYPHDFPLAIRVLKQDKEITINAGDPIAVILPISLSRLKEESIVVENFVAPEDYNKKTKSYGDAAQEINKLGKFTDWYRNAVDENGNSVGEHEVKALKLKVIDKTLG